MDHKYSRIENLEYTYILNKTPIYKEIDKQHIKKNKDGAENMTNKSLQKKSGNIAHNNKVSHRQQNKE